MQYLQRFPKIFTLGQRFILDIFDDEVEVTEKVDGSQFVFGNIDGEVHFRSKGREIYKETVDALFAPAVEYVSSIELPENVVFYGETLCKPRHNLLAYNRVPEHNVVIFGMSDLNQGFVSDYDALADLAGRIGLETVPLLFRGSVESPEELFSLLDAESYLGGVKVEGFVVKNYSKPFLLGGVVMPLMSGKFVSEKFKEKMGGWSSEKTTKGKWETYKTQFRTEARWGKAVQHLAEEGTLLQAPQDIGPLIKEVQRDIIEECKEDIKEYLWNEFGKDLLKLSIRGLPEWYKERLAVESFGEV